MGPKTTGNKRAAPTSSSSQPSANDAKRRKIFTDRQISSQSTSTAFNGEIDIANFVKAREFEINALESALKRSKDGLNRRAFQEVPRELRRRQASHNVKRVPARLRKRAKREMVEDNTPLVNSKTRPKSGKMRLRLDTAHKLQNIARSKKKERLKNVKDAKESDTAIEVTVKPITDPSEDPEKSPGTLIKPRKPKPKKNALAKPPVPAPKFRKRQIKKTWLPTHMFHTKRARMTEPKSPLWRFALPLAPAVKSYRPTHRASTLRGAIAWDMSYMATISLEGFERSLKGLLRALGVPHLDLEGAKRWRWRNGSRAWNGWLFAREAYPSDAIAPVTIIWCSEAPNDEPEAMDVSSDMNTKQAKRKLLIRVHPAAFLELWEQVGRLAKVQKPEVKVEDLRFEIGSIEITGPAATEALVSVLWPVPSSPTENGSVATVWNTLAGIYNTASLPKDVVVAFDATDPRLHHPPRRTVLDRNSEQKILEVITVWPLDKGSSPANIFSRRARSAAGSSLSSQKAINRRKSLAKLGKYPTLSTSDPKIPVLFYATRNNIHNGQGTWTLLLPWKCVLPVWQSLMYFPTSTGGNPRFGGLEQVQQLSFESGKPWFPGDFPSTKAGQDWELQERDKRKKSWERMPKSKRVAWDTLDIGTDKKGELGMGWACDWDFLAGRFPDTKERLQRVEKSYVEALVGKTPLPVSIDPKLGLLTINLKMVARGNPEVCGRIYRLPTANKTLKQAWLKLISASDRDSKNSKKLPYANLPPNAPLHERRARLAHILTTQVDGASMQDTHPPVPEAADLIGFVTTSNFNLGEGKATAIGSLLLAKVLSKKQGGDSAVSLEAGKENLCIVRNAGQKIGRLATWKIV